MNNRLKQSSINMISSALGYIIPMLINIVTTPLLLNGLGEAAFGLQSLVAVIIGYLTVMDMGMDLPIIKLLSEDRAKKDIESENRMLSTTLQIYVLIGFIGMLVIIVSADWLAKGFFKVPAESITQAVLVFRLAGVGFLGSVGVSWGRALAMGLQRFEFSYGVTVPSNLIGIVIGLVVVYTGHGVVGYVLVRVIVSLVSCPVYWWLAHYLLPTFKLKWGIDRITLRRVGKYVGYGTINRITSSLVSRLDQTLIGVWLGVAVAGVYSVPFMVVTSIGYMIAYMLGFIFPMASELQSLGEMNRLRDIFVRVTRFITALAGMIFIPFFVLGDIFLKLWVPGIADQATNVLRLLIISGFLGTLSITLTNCVVIGMGHIRQFTIYTIIRSAVLAASCMLMIRLFGLEGAGWALLLTTIVDIIYLIFALHYYLQLSPWILFRTAYLKPLLLSIVYGGLVFLIRPLTASWFGLGITALGLITVYITTGFLIGVFGETEKRVLSGLWQSITQRLKKTGKI